MLIVNHMTCSSVSHVTCFVLNHVTYSGVVSFKAIQSGSRAVPYSRKQHLFV